METTEGFYKYQEDIDILIYGPNFVLNREYELRKETKDQYTFPVDGWYWFDSELEARQFFNLPEKKEEELPISESSMNLPILSAAII